MFAVFFVAPIVWLVPGADQVRQGSYLGGRSASGASTVALAWNHLMLQRHIYRHWIANSLLYAFIATAIMLVPAIPAGYGLALGNIPGTQADPALTLI